MRMLIVGASGHVGRLVVASAVRTGRGVVAHVRPGSASGERATVETALVAGPNPFTVVRPSFITGPDRGEARPGEQAGALVGDAVCAVLRLVGARRLAARWRSVTGPALARILVDLAAAPLDRRVHNLDDFRR